MRRKTVPALLSLALLLALALPPAYAASEVIFTAVNDDLLPLSGSTMPTRRGGLLYVPYTVFTGGLGVYASYNSDVQVLLLFNWDHSMTFKLAEGVTYDEKGAYYANPAIFHNGTVYVCVSDVALKMGISYSYTSESDWSVIRLNRERPALSDSRFIQAARSTMNALAAEYRQSEEQMPGSPPSSGDPDVTAPVAQAVYLTFDGAPTGKILDALSEAGAQAAFFLSGDQLFEHAELLRRALGEGHGIGLTGLFSDGFSLPPEELAAGLDLSNELLFRLTRTKTRLARPPDGISGVSADRREALSEAGYRLWGWNVEPTPASSAASFASRAESQIARRSGSVTLALPATEQTGDALPRILLYLRRNGYFIREVGEWVSPVPAS